MMCLTVNPLGWFYCTTVSPLSSTCSLLNDRALTCHAPRPIVVIRGLNSMLYYSGQVESGTSRYMSFLTYCNEVVSSRFLPSSQHSTCAPFSGDVDILSFLSSPTSTNITSSKKNVTSLSSNPTLAPVR